MQDINNTQEDFGRNIINYDTLEIRPLKKNNEKYLEPLLFDAKT